MRGKPVLDDVARLDPEHHATVQMRFARNEIPDDIGAHHLFVDGVGRSRVSRPMARERLT
jgi:hypothetical protein